MKVTLRLMLLSVAMMLFGLHVRAEGINENQAKARALSFWQKLGTVPKVVTIVMCMPHRVWV